MNTRDKIYNILKKHQFKVSKDTRDNLKGAIYFALKGENFDGNTFVYDSIKKGAVAAVTDDKKIKGKNIYFVENALQTLQDMAKRYRQSFNIPIIAIGGSNGKSTSKDLISMVLKNEFIVHSTVGSLNNHFGVPLAILSMPPQTEIGVFEIGANHLKEHTNLLWILQPTHVVVTNNGLDHLEGFGNAKGARKANKEIYDWALKNKAKVFIDKNQKDLMDDSKKNERIIYPEIKLLSAGEIPLIIKYHKIKYKTQLFGSYNIKNIELAIAIGKYFSIDTNTALSSITKYKPLSKRSEIVRKNKMNFIVDCYNANPSSMRLALESFARSVGGKKGVILGDMLEMGKYSLMEHKKIVSFVLKQRFDTIILIGNNFKKVLKNNNVKWFQNSESAKEWFKRQNFNGFTFLLKGSRGVRVERVV